MLRGQLSKRSSRGARHAEKHGDPTQTIAQSIAADAPIQGGRRVLNAVYDSGGFAEAVTNEEIIEAVQWLGKEGICAEPASAASLAALKRAVSNGLVQPDDCVVCVITGSGLKQPSVIQQATAESELRLNASFDDLSKLLIDLWK